MMRAVSGGPSWRARLAIALGFDGNPLRRASDRAEAWIRTGLLIILLTAGPLAAVAAGQWTAHAGASETSVQPHAVRTGLVQSATATATDRPAEPLRGAQVLVRSHREGTDFTSAAVLTALMTLAVTALALLVLLRLVQGFLDWRRAAAWEAALRRWQEHEAF